MHHIYALLALVWAVAILLGTVALNVVVILIAIPLFIIKVVTNYIQEQRS
jgi:hypothetical protein